MPRVGTSDFASGMWWRFSSYKLRGGLIWPTRGAKLQQYDPWEEYRRAQPEGREIVPPYQSLLTLLHGLAIQPQSEREAARKGREITLTPESETRLLEWCTGHGLLGLLLQQVQMVSFPPRVERDVMQSDRKLAQTLRSYLRTSMGWQPHLCTFSSHGLPQTPNGELEIPGFLSELWPRPGVILQELGGTNWQQEPLNSTWARFFPRVPKEKSTEYPYPIPPSEKFWRLYAEPLDEFIEAGVLFQEALQGLARQDSPRGRARGIYPKLIHGLRTLHGLVAPVSLTLQPRRDGTFEQQWVAPSLLASFGMMALQDLAGQARVILCDRCKKPFVSGQYNVRYCSPTCRNTIQKQRYRQKLRTKEGGTK